MMQICRAEDGHVSQVNATLRDIERMGNLESFLHQEIGLEKDAIIAYLSDGRRLTNSNIRELAGVHDQSIFVFNKNYLDYDLEDVLQDLHVVAQFQLPVEAEDVGATPPIRPSQLATTYLRAAHLHHDHINTVVLSLHYQHEAIRIASASLDHNGLSIMDAFEGVSVGHRRELDKQAMLLAGISADLDLIGRVRIHSEFLSPTVRKAIEAGEKSRTLGDYVSTVKMKQVADACARTHEDLLARFSQLEGAIRDLAEGSDAVRSAVSTKKLVEDAEMCLRRSREQLDHITNCASALDGPVADPDRILRGRSFVITIRPTEKKSSLLRIQNASERKRRQLYRGELHGQLPFETRGMDDPVPTIDFSPSGNLDATYSLQREDVNGLLRVFDDLDSYAQTSSDATSLRAVRECRAALDKLVAKMDGLEAGFDRIAERSSIEADQQAYQDVVEQLQAAQDLLNHREAAFQEERRVLQADIHKLKAKLLEATTTSSAEVEHSDRLERELHQVKAQLEAEVSSRRIVEQRNAELQVDIEQQRSELAQALADATDQSRVAETLRQELAQVRADFEDVKALEARNGEKINNLLEEQAANLQKLEGARARGEDLEAQIQSLRTESEDVHSALKESKEEKDRLLRAQATEHERIIRDHLAEADGDRAVLERQFFELKAIQDHTDRQLKDLRAELEIANCDAVGLREELQRVEHELRDAHHVEKLLRDDLKAGRASQSDFDQRLEDSNRLVAQILDVAISFRDAHVKALHSAQLMTAHPSTSKQSTTLADSVFSTTMRHSIIGGQLDEPSPIDPSEPALALELLRAFDHDHFLEAIAKTGSTIRKWQKQCKEYRERAKGKISFRNFAKGDLALFLPTRNSVSKPWAAFNVSFPHYFLQATGHLAEQLKTREWIVARITSITERVVDPQDPSSNPYGLGEGIKFYMLEVEDWTQPGHSKRRGSSRKVSSDQEVKDLILSSSPPAPPPGPPETEVEESFLVTHPPNSALFPVRPRSNTSPTARPSSLSRLLAQASPDSQIEPAPQSPPIRSPSPVALPSHPAPSNNTSPVPQHVPTNPSPLRPGSRASRLSTTSKFSSRPPVLGNGGSSPMAKAAPTIALSEHPILSSSPSSSSLDGNPFGLPATPSPDRSVSNGMPDMLSNRRRTTSYHIPKSSPLAAASTSAQSKLTQAARAPLTASSTLANFASSWGFRRPRSSETDADNGPRVSEAPNDFMANTDRNGIASDVLMSASAPKQS
ncbi:hypothetical protein H0H92_008905 [Tricholoma furcatifolium]|nr:hypothetical protein H0H92_008905 [Tricholoma furcatifolium]